jgi:hypothetical protein
LHLFYENSRINIVLYHLPSVTECLWTKDVAYPDGQGKHRMQFSSRTMMLLSKVVAPSFIKKKAKSKKKRRHKGCCGDACKCLTCAKIFLHTLKYYSFKESENTIYHEKNNMPVLFHSFDFHLSLTNPPQV